MAATAKVQVGGEGRVAPNVFTGASDPTVDNDATDGVQVGDMFINTTADKVFSCTDTTAGAAVWVLLGSA